jgi:hypothetical protein
MTSGMPPPAPRSPFKKPAVSPKSETGSVFLRKLAILPPFLALLREKSFLKILKYVLVMRKI